MADGTKIEWTDATWNPIGGCAVKSPGCTNCYAQRIAGSGRLRKHPLYAGTTTLAKTGPVFNGHLTVAANDHPVWTWPLRWRGAKAPRRGPGARSTIFVGDMSDLFHEDRPFAVIDKVFAVMALAPQHTFQVLTKRAERMRAYMEANAVRDSALRAGSPWPLPNVWLGVSVEDQARADERIPFLLATPAAKRFVSAEPLLGPIDLTSIRGYYGASDEWRADRDGTRERMNVLRGSDRREHLRVDGTWNHRRVDDPNGDPCFTGNCHPRLDWVIAGGESGPDARPMHPDWARSLRDQCAAANVPFFFKQWGAHLPAELLPDAGDNTPWRQPADGGDKYWGFDELGKPRDSLPTLIFSKVGKKAAGALLDGRERREFPR